MNDAEARSVVAEFRTVTAEQRRSMWNTAIPSRFRDARIGDLHGEVHAAIVRWTEAPSNLLLLGPVGSGKTHAAVAAAWDRFAYCDESVIFRQVGRLLDDLRPDGHADIVTLCATDLLILDDLGAEKPTDWTRERLDVIVNDRWINGRAVVVTSNLTSGHLRDALDPRLWSRLVDDATAVRVTGADRRDRA